MLAFLASLHLSPLSFFHSCSRGFPSLMYRYFLRVEREIFRSIRVKLARTGQKGSGRRGGRKRRGCKDRSIDRSRSDRIKMNRKGERKGQGYVPLVIIRAQRRTPMTSVHIQPSSLSRLSPMKNHQIAHTFFLMPSYSPHPLFHPLSAPCFPPISHPLTPPITTLSQT